MPNFAAPIPVMTRRSSSCQIMHSRKAGTLNLDWTLIEDTWLVDDKRTNAEMQPSLRLPSNSLPRSVYCFRTVDRDSNVRGVCMGELCQF